MTRRDLPLLLLALMMAVALGIAVGAAFPELPCPDQAR